MPHRGHVTAERNPRNAWPKDVCVCGRTKMVRSSRCHACFTAWPDRFWARVDRTDKCWLWLGRTDGDGYGIISVNHQNKKAHRIGWAAGHLDALPPDDLTIDHLCRNKRCVRPLHMELVTSAVNAGRRWWWA